MLLIGNNILSRHVSNDYTTTGTQNRDINPMVNVDIDGDNSTTNSSSATLTVPSTTTCYKVVYAGLYWSAVVKGTASTTAVKFKVPNGSYVDITGTSIYSATTANANGSTPYLSYANVTSYIPTNPQGVYTVGNVSSATGARPNFEGLSAGWSLFVVYEDPTMPSKYITSFDGFASIDQNNNLTIPVSGFKTIPSGSVHAKYAFSSIEGDNSVPGDLLKINGTTISATNSAGTVIRPANNFFNSSVSYIKTATNTPELFTDRLPKSSNTLGFDAGILNIPNGGNTVIKNGDTSASIRLESTLDVYYFYFNAFAVDVIEPKIVLTKEVFDNSSPTRVNMGDKDVTLSQQLNYVIGFQNIGNDPAQNFTIKDVLPININFKYPDDITSLPAPITVGGVTYNVTHTYNAATRTIVFTIPKQYVEVSDPRYLIELKVKVVDFCNQLSDACSNIIRNSAYATYTGTDNKAQITDDPSLSSFTACNLGVPQATNFLVGVDNCEFTKSEVLCGNSVIIKASNGYSSYKWSTAAFDKFGVTTGTILGIEQTLSVTNPGKYYVYNTAVAPCLSITEVVTVARAGTTTTNPLLSLPNVPDKIVTCISGGAGKQLPYFFLCGADATRLLTANISDGATIVWERLSKTDPKCSAVTDPNCANEDTSCNWEKMGEGSTYTLTGDSSGEYRLTLNYPGNCFNRFYFNVYQNTLKATETHSDIICNTKGNITVGGIPIADYEYSISSANGNTPSVPYQNSNSFTINAGGSYTVFIKQKGVSTNPCVFEIKDIVIRQRNFTVDQFVTHPVCFNDKGKIKVAANDVRGPYTYEIFKNGVSVDRLQNTANADYTFTGLESGRYKYTVTTADGCTYTNYDVAINDPAGEIKATPSIKVPLTACNKGIIKIETQQDRNYGNTFYYFVNGSSTFQTSNEIEVTASGLYTIRVVGLNNCEKTITQQVDLLPKPTYTVTNTNTNCYDEKAKINIDLNGSSAGYKVEYSINNGATYVEGSATGIEFANLYAGQYKVLVRFSVTYPINNWPGTETVICPLDPVKNVTINGPTSGVTASAGVGELAGCGPLQGGEPTGLLRITNVEGGTVPYQYSFDGGNLWENVTQKYVKAGTYNLAVKDALGCIFKIPYTVTLDPKPADPDIDDNINTVYNCDGTATATVIVSNPTSTGGTTYTYEYYLKTGTNPPVANTPITSNIFNNVPSGDHTIIVKYNVKTVSSFSNLLQEDFGRGNDTKSPGINTAYCWEKQDGNTLAFADCRRTPEDWNPWLLNDGDYVVTKALLPDHDPDFRWILPKDHTAVLNSTPTITDGRFLAVNIGKLIPKGAVLYSKTINDVLPNQEINVSLYMINLLKSSNGLASPQLTVQLVKNGAVVGTPVDFPEIPRDEKWHSTTDLAGGTIFKLNPGNNTSLEFQILSNLQEESGNDLAIDDIHVYQVPKACGNESSIPVKIEAGKAFKASLPTFSNVSCFGGNNGTITLAAENFGASGYQYSVNGAAFQTTTLASLTIPGFGVGTHTIIVRSDATGTCQYTLKQEIKAPAVVTVTASITKQPTCTTKATITAVGGGGTLTGYWYELRNTTGGAVVRVFQNNAQFTDVPAGNYTVFARDSNSCVSPIGAPVNVVDPSGFTASIDATSDLCYDTTNQAKLVVTVSGGLNPFSYSLNGGASQTGNTFNTVGVGTHTIVVTDSNNCTFTINNIKIEPQLTLNLSLIQDLTCLVNASIGNPVITGGYGTPYTYTVSRNGATPAAVASFPYTTALAGSYVFTVKDSKSCPAVSTPIVVSAKTTPTLTADKTDITCNNKNDGTITVTAANGFTAVYTYAIKLNTAATYTTQTTNQFTGLAAGLYNIKVIDSKGCESAVTDVTIVNPAVVGGTIGATELGCSGTGTVPAVVTVNGSGGVGPYEYSFNGTSSFGPDNTFSTTTAQTVTAYIKDKNGCQFGPLSTVIAPKTLITGINVMFETGLECPAYEAHVKFQAIGGLSPIRYQIVSGPAGYSSAVVSDGEFKNLKPGDYVFRATDKNGCSFDLDYNVKSLPDIAAGGSVLTPIKCFGDKGSIQFTVTGVKDRGYDYVIKNASNVIIQSANNVSETITTINVTASQPAGAYTITVTDRKTSCPATYTVNLTQPAVALSITSAAGTNVNCKNDESKITVAVTGGTTNYSYAYAKSPSTVPTSAYVTGAVLIVDTNSGADLVWDVYVKDANDCTAKRTVTIIKDAIPSVTAVVSNQCTASGSNFTITATGTGGTGTLTYGINGETGTFQPGNTFTVAPGNYTVWVKDGNQCTASAAAVTVYPQLTLIATPAVDVTCTPNTTINLSAGGGTGAYTYAVSFNGGSYGTSSNPYVTSVAGTYRFRVTDSATPACQAFSTDIIVSTKATVLTLTTTKVDVKCKDDATGSISITATSGKAPYTYSVTKGGLPVSTTALTTGLKAGTYDIVITDALGCTSASTPVTILEPAVGLSASAAAPATTTCSTTATVTVTAAGGTGAYEYSFNGGAFGPDNFYVVNDNGTSDQVIAYQVRDANGCTTVSQNITVKKLNPPTGINFSTPATITCLATTTSITLTSVGGVSPFSYTIVSGPTINTIGASSGTFTGLLPGDYVFEVKDANGCTKQATKKINAAAAITVAGGKTNEKCFGANDGTATFTVTGASGAGNYSYTISPTVPVSQISKSGNTVTVTGLGANTYTLTVTDLTTGCSSSSNPVTVGAATVINYTVSGTKINCKTTVSTLTFTGITGGSPGYTYAYAASPSTVPSTAYGTSATVDTAVLTSSIDVYVKDNNGCFVKKTVTIGSENIPTIVTPASQCYTGTAVSVTITGTGTGTKTYSKDGTNYVSSPTFSLTPGSYTLYLKDGFGCVASTPYVVAPQLALIATPAVDVTCTPNTTINLSAGGGTGAYTYAVSFNGGSYGTSSNPYVTSVAGTYRFRVTDSATPACQAFSTDIIVSTKATVLTLTTTKVDVKCKGDSTGSISITATSGKAPYTYSVTKGGLPVSTTALTTGLKAGTYDIVL
ncbi:beta strand repeat-containing protein, partial [Flavobacterium aquicola]|uniref:beta strand repeat-containing protein n=1 Tax=Flavobacterium aquicola TaxID=1682742 RepID=UPI001472CDA7